MSKGSINKYIENVYNKIKAKDKYQEIFDKTKHLLTGKAHYLEISHYHSPAYKVLNNLFEKGDFISDDPFEALLELHLAKDDNIPLDVYNYNFKDNLTEKFKAEKYDAIFSFYGLSFTNLSELIEKVLTLLKINGIFVLEFPAYWFIKGETLPIEKEILEYSKINDKKWLFVKPIEELVKENKCKLEIVEKLSYTHTFNRQELAYLSSLDTLYNAELARNKAHLEICNIPEKNIELQTGLIVIKKEEKVLTKDNIFNF